MAATKKTDQLSSNNLIIIVLLITLLVVGVSGLVAKSLVTTIIRDTKVVQKKSAAEKQLKKNIDAAPELVESYGKLGEKAVVLADALPNTADFPSIIVTLENMTNSAGLKLKSVAPSVGGQVSSAVSVEGSTLSPQPKPFPMSVNFTGSYPGLLTMLREIETSARPMRVLDIQLTGGGSALTGLVNIETYYQDKAELPFSKETVK